MSMPISPRGITHPAARPVVGAVVGLLVGALVVGLSVLIVQTWGITNAMRESQQTNSQTYDAILSCTDPAGECAKRGAKTTSKAVADIAEVSIIASACADRDGAQNALTIERCVRREVERRAAAEK